jgi:TPP-dependent pyruvate/acetoin dehydrogenase alpha subunit
MLHMLSKMVLIRTFENNLFDVYDSMIKYGAVHLYSGQEAVAVGFCEHLTKDDTITGSHRSHGYYLAKGGDVNALMAEIAGKATGCCKGKGGSMHVTSPQVGFLLATGMVGPAILLATGASLAHRVKADKNVCVAFFGEGAQSTGSLHESLYYASLWQLPIVFVCEANGFQSASRAEDLSLSTSIAERAAGYGIPGALIDGNDVLEVYQKARPAIERARAGEGPSLFEAKTYRYAGHALLASGHLQMGGRSTRFPYGVPGSQRTKDELDFWLAKDPIERLKRFMTDKKLLSDQELNEIYEQAEHAVTEATRFAETSPYPDPADAFTDVWSEKFA